MSQFDALVKSNVVKKKSAFKIPFTNPETKEETELTFYAVEISYAERLKLSVDQQMDKTTADYLIVYAIEDSDGNHMTLEQARALPDEIAQKFSMEAMKINYNIKFDEEEEKN